MLGHDPHTIKHNLGLTGLLTPKSQKVVLDMEHFMYKMVNENSSFAWPWSTVAR